MVLSETAYACLQRFDRRIRPDGYVELYLPDHPDAAPKGFAPEHIVVMELFLGGRLPPHAVVHHRDRERGNNRLANLLLIPSRWEHVELHRAMRSRDVARVRRIEDHCRLVTFQLRRHYRQAQLFSPRSAGGHGVRRGPTFATRPVEDAVTKASRALLDFAAALVEPQSIAAALRRAAAFATGFFGDDVGAAVAELPIAVEAGRDRRRYIDSLPPSAGRELLRDTLSRRRKAIATEDAAATKGTAAEQAEK